MCGIIGILTKKEDIQNTLINGLNRLSYRGYDSAGIAIISQNNTIECVKAIGDITELEKKIKTHQCVDYVGIAHTRWATHGNVSLKNAHPHYTESVAVVHNGVIENYHQVKKELELEGWTFNSDTDSELIPILITKYLKAGFEKHVAIRRMINHLEGSMSILIIFNDEPEKLYGYKKNTPLILSFNEDRSIIAVSSDIFSIIHLNKYYINVNDDEMVILEFNKTFDNKNNYDANYIYDHNYQLINKKVNIIDKNNDDLSGKGNYPHYFLKEIYEQPVVALETINYLYSQEQNKFLFDKNLIKHIKHSLKIVGCGSSYLVGTIGEFWLEELAEVNVSVDIASEFRCKHEPLKFYDAFLYISQSGETADVIASAKHIKKNSDKPIFAMTNNMISSLSQMSSGNIFTKAGIEISVASTKTFTTQAVSFALLSIAIAQNKNLNIDIDKYCENILTIPRKITNLLNDEELIEKIKSIAKIISGLQSIFYVGRGLFYSVAMEASLKLKELSYIHSEAIPAGELKHGPIALIDENTYIVALCPKNEIFEKMGVSIEEILARKGKMIIISDDGELSESFQSDHCEFINLNVEYDIFASPILYSIVCQLIAYYTALYKKNNIDKPRNLAKSVTVE